MTKLLACPPTSCLAWVHFHQEITYTFVDIYTRSVGLRYFILQNPEMNFPHFSISRVSSEGGIQSNSIYPRRTSLCVRPTEDLTLTGG